eukprot:scaffold1173_cov117-Amphora_coffeaeformis.AAC.2
MEQHCMRHVKALVGGALVGAPHFASMPNSSERTICSGVRSSSNLSFGANRSEPLLITAKAGSNNDLALGD